MILLLGVSLGTLQQRGAADTDPLPTPRRLSDDEEFFSPAEFGQLLQKLKTEREGLNSDWLALRKRNSTPEPSVEAEQKRFESLMQKALEDLRERRLHPGSSSPLGSEAAKKKTEAEPEEPKKMDNAAPAPEGKAEKSPGAVDVLAQAHTLMRSKQYEEALATFQQVDLKGKKINERTPIQYLKACCLLHLGKTKEAGEVLQEVANYRSDEKVAGYAQWHLEMMRWQRDVAQRLQEIRQRRQALETDK
jgi:hypothetical protein